MADLRGRRNPVPIWWPKLELRVLSAVVVAGPLVVDYLGKDGWIDPLSIYLPIVCGDGGEVFVAITVRFVITASVIRQYQKTIYKMAKRRRRTLQWNSQKPFKIVIDE